VPSNGKETILTAKSKAEEDVLNTESLLYSPDIADYIK